MGVSVISNGSPSLMPNVLRAFSDNFVLRKSEFQFRRPLSSVYVNEVVFDDRQTDYAGLVVIPFPLGEGRYFVLGDNRADSLDSR